MKQPGPVNVRPPKKKPEPVAPFPEHGHVCLNCGHQVSNNFCSMCGQSTATHRLSIMHFLLHDMVHSFWHVDTGIFVTLKDVLIRPGYAAIDYIRGRRAGRFPILTLLLLLTGLALWLYSLNAPAEAQASVKILGDDVEFVRRLDNFVEHNKKWLLLCLLPIGSFSTLIVFRRTRLNYTEHLLVNSYVFGGLLVLLVIIRLICLAIPATTGFLEENKGLFGILFYVFGYWQAFHKAYRIPGMVWRFGVLWLLNVFFLISGMLLTLGTVRMIRPAEFKPDAIKQQALDSVRD